MAEILKGILGSVIFQYIVVPIVAGLTAFALARWTKARENWSLPIIVLVGVFAFTLIIFCVNQLWVFATRWTQNDVVIPAKIESDVRRWADLMQLAVKRDSNDENVHWSLVLTTMGGRQFAVTQDKSLDRYVVFTTSVTLSEELRNKLKKLTPQQLKRLTNQVRVEMVRAGIEYQMPESVLVPFTIRKVIPIATLQEASFIEAVRAMDGGIILAQLTTELGV